MPAPPPEFFAASYPFTHSEDLDFILDGNQEGGLAGLNGMSILDPVDGPR